MEYDKIKELINDVSNSKIFVLNIELPDGTKVSMTKDLSQELKESTFNNPEEKQDIVNIKNEKTNDNLKIIKSPMVGTFYLTPSPTSVPYVEVGNTVKKGEIVCIIEAMKLMNEIESEFDGEIVEICLKNGDTVEYGTPLFKLK